MRASLAGNSSDAKVRSRRFGRLSFFLAADVCRERKLPNNTASVGGANHRTGYLDSKSS